jgi:hypothetical protein
MPVQQTDEPKLRSQLQEIFLKEPEIISVLKAMRNLDLPDCWLAGGAVRNTVWKHLYGEDCQLTIKDFDVVFFEKDSGREVEAKAKEALTAQFPHHLFDVKNQASFGHWRPWRYQFISTTDGIAHFLHTATGIGIRLNDEGIVEYCSEYGLDDLFAGILRFTPFPDSHKDAAEKARLLMSKCSKLKLVTD